MVFKNGGELEKNEELHMEVQKQEVVNEVSSYQKEMIGTDWTFSKNG